MEKTSENPQQIETQDNKNDKNKATPAYTQQQLEANTQIKGFLAIYLLTAIIGVVYSLFLGLKAYNILGEDLSSNIAIANIFTILRFATQESTPFMPSSNARLMPCSMLKTMQD